MKEVLIVEKRGCNFWKDDEEMKKYSDLENYRLYSHCLNKNGQSYHVEFNRINLIIKNKTIHCHKLGFNTQYDTQKGSFRDLGIEEKVSFENYEYKKDDIIKLVNKYFDNKIEEIRIYNNIYNEIESIAGYREKTILNSCIKTELIEDTKDYEVIRFYAKIENELKSFDYEVKSKRIVG